MKRTVVHQANPVDFPAPDSQKGVDVSKQVTLGTSKACTSAAVIGLAISMGASSLLMTREGDRVMASESTPQSYAEKQLEPTSVDLGSASLTPSPNRVLISSVKATKTLPGKVVWDLSQKTEVDDSLIVKAQTLESVSPSQVTESLPVSPSAGSEVKSNLVGSETRPTINTQSHLQNQVVPPAASSLPGQPPVNLPVVSSLPTESLETGKPQVSQLNNLPTTGAENGSVRTYPETQKSDLSSLSARSQSSGGLVETPPGKAQTDIRVYQIKPGDTLNGIARQYGVSVSELMALNNITDPNVLFVYESLKIPETRVNPVIPVMGQATSPVKESSPEALTPDAINFGSNLSSATSTTVKEMRPTTTVSAAASPLDSSSGSSPAKTETVAVVTTPTPVNVWTAKDLGSGTPVQSVKESSIKPYENRLQSDLSRLRAEYEKTHQASEEENTSKNVQAERSHPVNPEFKAEYAQAIRTEKTPHQSRHWLEQVQRLRTEQLSTNAEEPTQPVARSSDNRTIVATAPIGAAGYDPLKNPVLERMVSPELPPLPGADRYLPGGSPRSQGFIWPSKGDLTSGYGWRWGRMHRGIDIASSIGTPVVAADNGLVTYAGWNDGGYGYLVEITHSNGSVTLYAHNDRILVREGQQVTQGQQISEMGSTGFSTGPHLHFEIHPTGKGAVDPMAFLPSTNSVASGQ